jgi:hypothetical protein
LKHEVRGARGELELYRERARMAEGGEMAERVLRGLCVRVERMGKAYNFP